MSMQPMVDPYKEAARLTTVRRVAAMRDTIRETLVDFLDWETTYPQMGMTEAEAVRDYDHLTDRLVAALIDGEACGNGS